MLLLLLLLPDAVLHRPYRPEPAPVAVGARCPQPLPMARLAGGGLPPGLSLGSRGNLSGTPRTPGTYNFALEISDGCSRRREDRTLRVVPAPILVAEAEQLAFEAVEGAPQFSALPVRVSGSQPGQPYRVEVFDAPWLAVSPRSGNIPGEDTGLEADVVYLRVTPKGLAPGNYRGLLRISSWGAANAPEMAVTLRVHAYRDLVPGIQPLPSAGLRFESIVVPPPSSIVPPPVRAVEAAPRFPKPGRHRTVTPGSGAPTRSRVLPFPKVQLRPQVPAAKPVTTLKPEPAPERTKPPAMPPSAH